MWKKVLVLFLAGVAAVFAAEFVARTDWHVKAVAEYRAKNSIPADKPGEPMKTMVSRWAAAAGAVAIVAVVVGGGEVKVPVRT